MLLQPTPPHHPAPHPNTHTGAALAPQDERLLTQQGGCLVMEGTRVLYKHTDSGILKYANVDDVVRAALSGKDQVVERTPTQVLRSFT